MVPTTLLVTYDFVWSGFLTTNADFSKNNVLLGIKNGFNLKGLAKWSRGLLSANVLGSIHLASNYWGRPPHPHTQTCEKTLLGVVEINWKCSQADPETPYITWREKKKRAF